jgi:hypothetical protein
MRQLQRQESIRNARELQAACAVDNHGDDERVPLVDPVGSFDGQAPITGDRALRANGEAFGVK